MRRYGDRKNACYELGMGNLAFWQLDDRSDAEVLARVNVLVGSSRQLTAELVAHLGEVEERRLHLRAAFGSMFQYCVVRLGLSEDEACRRIDVARLARRFPLLFPALASGELSLSVAALLKPHLTEQNQVELLKRLSGKSLRRAHECLAELFPRPDIASKIRKLPDRTPVPIAVASEVAAVVPFAETSTPVLAPSGMTSRLVVGAASDRQLAAAREMLANPIDSVPSEVANENAPGTRREIQLENASLPWSGGDSLPLPHASEGRLGIAAASGDAIGVDGVAGSPGSHWGGEGGVSPSDAVFDSKLDASGPEPSRGRGQAGRLEPLALGRYRVQFTASLALKEKLELARDLMRHTNPSGDFAPIIERALDLLLAQLMRRRFGKTRKAQHDSAATSPSQRASEASQRAGDSPATALSTTHTDLSPSMSTHISHSLRQASGDVPASDTDRITQATRRAVSERDGLQCTWVGDDGRRCSSRAWLEHDHRRPRGKGGSSEAYNIRILCRAHNRLAAELAYGREHVEQSVRQAMQSRHGYRADGSTRARERRPLCVRNSRQPCWLARAPVADSRRTGSGKWIRGSALMKALVPP